MAKIDLQEVRLIGVIVSYAEGLFVPKAFEEGGQAKFGASFIALPDQAVAVTEMIEKAVLAAAAAKFGADRKSWGRLRGIHKEALVKDISEYPKMGEFPSGTIFVRAGSKEAPGFTDAHGEEMPFDEAKRLIRSGFKVNALLRTYGYSHATGNGVSIGLNVVQPIRHVMNLGGRPAAKGAFGALSAEELGEAV
jgi:hypothetical protein